MPIKSRVNFVWRRSIHVKRVLEIEPSADEQAQPIPPIKMKGAAGLHPPQPWLIRFVFPKMKSKTKFTPESLA